MRVVTTEFMRSLDAAACALIGETELLRRAGCAVAAVVRRYRSEGRVIGLAGFGNNGGDVFAALAELGSSYERIAITLDPGERASTARRNAELRARASGAAILTVGVDEYAHLLSSSAFFLDGLLGVGARAGMSETIRSLTKAANRHAQGAVLAIDVPTGMDASSGLAESDAIAARATITLGAVKLGLLLEHARPYVGDLWFDDFGMESLELGASNSLYSALDEAEAAASLPRRALDTDKRGAGTPLIIAGSERFPGAAVLCARAAARAGAGYVTVAAPRSAAPILRSHLVEQVVFGFSDEPARAAEELLNLAQRHGSLAIGPGLELSEALETTLLQLLRESALPAVIDAGGILHFSKNLAVLHGKRVVLTPHAGEFAALSGAPPPTSTQRLARLRAFTREHGICTLLKGATTLIDDGSRVSLNTTGTPALATAGTGDVLTGMIATLLSQGMPPFEAASLAAYWHGQAGQAAARRRPIGVIAGDLIEELAEALPRPAPRTMPMRIL